MRLSTEKKLLTVRVGLFSLREKALSQAAACDGTTVTTSAVGQEYVPGTLPIY